MALSRYMLRWCCLAIASVATVPPIMVVDLGQQSLATRISVQVCVGLFNRNESRAGAAYTLGLSSEDSSWLAEVEGVVNPVLTPVADFLQRCMGSEGVAKGYIRYNATSQKLLIPYIITLAGVLDAVPLEDSHRWNVTVPMAFDAESRFSGFSELDATSFMYDNYVNMTTSMSKMNPGLDVHHHPVNPPLTGSPDIGLTDYIVKERLFNMFLNEGCIPLTKEHALMEKIVNANPWPKPIVVYGYDDTFGIEGDLFEAETNCVKEHNLGQVATVGVNNLAFFSRKPAITSPLRQNKDPIAEAFNSSRTYLALVIGDGDNMAFIKGSRKDWMQERVKRCSSGKGCFPLLWTLSPHSLHLAPDWARWYYNQSYATGNDFFVLPPSGDLYAYPEEMRDADQAAFVANTERDCTLMSTNSAVAWEWTLTWSSALKHYFPRYAERNIVRGLFTVNVPFNLPIIPFIGVKDHFDILDEHTVVFKPREWRGGGKPDVPFSKNNYLTAKDMAAEINKYPKGTVSHIYLTSDGGANLGLLYDMVQQLDEHVQIVNHNAIVEMALQSKRTALAYV